MYTNHWTQILKYFKTRHKQRLYVKGLTLQSNVFMVLHSVLLMTKCGNMSQNG